MRGCNLEVPRISKQEEGRETNAGMEAFIPILFPLSVIKCRRMMKVVLLLLEESDHSISTPTRYQLQCWMVGYSVDPFIVLLPMRLDEEEKVD